MLLEGAVVAERSAQYDQRRDKRNDQTTMTTDCLCVVNAGGGIHISVWARQVAQEVLPSDYGRAQDQVAEPQNELKDGCHHGDREWRRILWGQ